MGGENSLTKHV